jgi:hypothetical protein
MKQIVIAGLLILSIPTLSRGQDQPGAVTGHAAESHLTAPASVGARPSSWKVVDGLADNSGAGAGGLDLRMSPTEQAVEEITVYGRRHVHEENPQRLQNSPIRIGAATIEGSETSRGSFSGMAVSAAIPIAGVPGLEATFNLSGGHDQLNASTTTTSANATAGLRLKF